MTGPALPQPQKPEALDPKNAVRGRCCDVAGVAPPLLFRTGMRSLATGIGVLLWGCAAEGPPGDHADAGPPAAQGTAPEGILIVNEVSPVPDSGADWIELLNRGDAPIDLCEFFLTDQRDRLDHYLALGGPVPPDPCPPRLLGARERLVVLADDALEPALDHAGFALAEADEVHLVSRDGIGLDGVLYLVGDGERGRALARIPDGEGAFFLAEPSPGRANPELP